MLQAFIAVLLGLAVHDIFYELIARYQNYKFRKNVRGFHDYLEDWEADDEDI
jgi:hypothetical protein